MITTFILAALSILCLVAGVLVYRGRITLRAVRRQSAYNRSMGFAIGMAGAVFLIAGMMDMDANIHPAVSSIVLGAGLVVCLLSMWRIQKKHTG